MSKQSGMDRFKAIDRSAMDALLYGIANGLGYLGQQRQVMFDRMSGFMLEYLTKCGVIVPSDKPEAIEKSLRKLLVRSGFGPKMPLKFEGSPPRPSLPGFINYLSGDKGWTTVAQGRASRPVAGSRVKKRVDWVLYEMVLYGMTKGLDELGEQAQLLIDGMGTEMLNYLVETGEIEPSDDPDVFVRRASEYFGRVGFADKRSGFKMEGSPPDTLIGTYVYSRYHINVLRRLRETNCALYSCPPCLVGNSIMRKATGMRLQFGVEFELLPGGTVVIRHKIHRPTETFTEEQAEKVSRLIG